MRKKPYLECPFCGCQVATLKERLSDSIRVRKKYECPNCKKKLAVPGWCLWLEFFVVVGIVVALFIAFVFIVYKGAIPPWLQKGLEKRLSLEGLVITILAFAPISWIHKIIALFLSHLVPLAEPFDYGDYSMVSRHKGNDSDEQE